MWSQERGSLGAGELLTITNSLGSSGDQSSETVGRKSRETKSAGLAELVCMAGERSQVCAADDWLRRRCPSPL
jgi:hypothetical protein